MLAGQAKQESRYEVTRQVTGGVTCLFLLLGGPLPFTLTTAPAPRPLPGVSLLVDAGGRGGRAHGATVVAILQGPFRAPRQLNPILGLLEEDGGAAAHAAEGGAGQRVRGHQGQSVDAIVAEQALQGLAA